MGLWSAVRRSAVMCAVCALPFDAASAATLRLPAGTHVSLTLQHHITSSQTPGGTPIYFRVADDIKAQDQILIAKGTLVSGRMEATRERGALASSGSFNFGVRFVPAVDGQNVRVIASLSRNARSRDGALVGWTFFWGLPGLITKGVDAYALRGSELDAEVLSDKLVTIPDTAAAVPTSPPATGTAEISHHQYGSSRNQTISVYLEKAGRLPPLTLGVASGSVGGSTVTSARLLRINGQEPGEGIAAQTIDQKGIAFDSWSLLRYCDNGANPIEILLTLGSGDSAIARYSLPVKLIAKDLK
jgi:hypothetical protein